MLDNLFDKLSVVENDDYYVVMVPQNLERICRSLEAHVMISNNLNKGEKPFKNIICVPLEHWRHILTSGKIVKIFRN